MELKLISVDPKQSNILLNDNKTDLFLIQTIILSFNWYQSYFILIVIKVNLFFTQTIMIYHINPKNHIFFWIKSQPTYFIKECNFLVDGIKNYFFLSRIHMFRASILFMKSNRNDPRRSQNTYTK